MTADTDYWACRVCRSINVRRSNRCYSCHTPREAAAVNPTDLPTTGKAPPVVHTGTYRSTETLAVLVTLAAALFVLATLAATLILWQAGDLEAARQLAASRALMADMTPVIVLAPILGVVTLLAYAGWISRVVSNLPALGLGYSRVSSTMAFIEPLIPGFNLYALPARMGEMLRKLDEKGPGLPLLGLAWILVVGPAIAAGILIRLSIELESTSDFLRTRGFALFLGVSVEAVGIGLGLYLVWMIERLARTRAAAPPSGPTTAGERVAG